MKRLISWLDYSCLTQLTFLSSLIFANSIQANQFDPRASGKGICFPKHVQTYMRSKAGSLDPNEIVTFMDNQIAMAVFGQLTTLDEYENVKPDLAKFWRVSPDGRIVSFELKDNLKFSDGQPVEAADVVHTFHRLFSPKLSQQAGLYLFGKDIEGLPEYLAGTRKNISGISASNRLKVEFRFSKPRSNFLTMLAMGPASIVPRTTLFEKVQSERIPSAGPFFVQKFSPEHVLTAANKHYQKQVGIEKLEYLFENKPICELLSDGKYAFVDAGPMDQPSCQSEKFVENRYPGANTWLIAFGERTNDDVRRVLATCVDRDSYLKKLAEVNVTALSRDSLFPELERASKKVSATSKSESRCHLPSKTKITLYTSKLYNNSGLPLLFSKISNLDLRVEEVDDSQHRELRKTGKYDLLFLTFNGTFSDPTFESSLFSSDGGILKHSYKNAEYDRYANSILRAKGSKEQNESMKNLETFIKKHPPAIFVKQHDNVEWIRRDLNSGATGWFYRYFALKTAEIRKGCVGL